MNVLRLTDVLSLISFSRDAIAKTEVLVEKDVSFLADRLRAVQDLLDIPPVHAQLNGLD